MNGSGTESLSKPGGALQVEEGDETVARLVARCEVHPCQNWIKMKDLTQGDAGSLTTVRDRAPGAKKAPDTAALSAVRPTESGI